MPWCPICNSDRCSCRDVFGPHYDLACSSATGEIVSLKRLDGATNAPSSAKKPWRKMRPPNADELRAARRRRK